MADISPKDVDLNNNVCQECGLPLRIHSYEKIKQEKEKGIEKIKIKLSCYNIDHQKINEIELEDYQKLIQNNLDKICKCVFCNQILSNTQIPYYCYDCRKILCEKCLNNDNKKEHKNIFKYEDLQDKCLIHNKENNEITFYCLICKKRMCSFCWRYELSHVNSHNIKNIDQLKIDNNTNIVEINQEQKKNIKDKDNLINQLKIVENKINFNNLLLNVKDNCFHLFNLNNEDDNSLDENSNNQINNSLDNKEINNNNSIITPMNNKTEQNNTLNIENKNKINDNLEVQQNNIERFIKNDINVIYHDENIKFDGLDIINDCLTIQSNINSSIILTNDLFNLDLFLKIIYIYFNKAKFILIVNGGSSEKTIKFIKENYYQSQFLTACIYTQNLKKYSKIKEENSDFVEMICTDSSDIIKFIKKNDKLKNGLFEKDPIINIHLYQDLFFPLHKRLSIFFGDESKNSFSKNIEKPKHLLYKDLYAITDYEINLMKCFNSFSELQKKDYENIINNYLKDNYFSGYLNRFLNSKELNVLNYIEYFAGNLMYCFVEYGKKNNKGVNSRKTFYRGELSDVIELMEYLKNRGLLITYPCFLKITEKKELAQVSSKRDMNYKNKDLYSVIFKIDYFYQKGYEPSVIDLKDLLYYPDEYEYILLPFTFLKLKKIEINSTKLTADIELEIIGKDEVLEYQIGKSKGILEYNEKENKMYVK